MNHRKPVSFYQHHEGGGIAVSEEVEPISKAELLNAIRVERQKLEQTLARLDQAQMTEPRVEGEWSVKDILAHLVAWEGRMVRWLGEAHRGQVPQIPATWDDVHQLNAQSYREQRDRSLEDVLLDFHRSYREALETVEAFPEGDLVDPDRFVWRKGQPLWVMVAANTSWHYKEHTESIRTWLEKSPAR